MIEYQMFIRDAGGKPEGLFFCRAMGSLSADRRYCSSCPLGCKDEAGRFACRIAIGAPEGVLRTNVEGLEITGASVEPDFENVKEAEELVPYFPNYKDSNPLVLKAYRYAKRAHAGQFRKGTTVPYFVHVLEAGGIVRRLTDDPEIIAAAILHDIIEDTSYTYDDLCTAFGKRVADMVQEVSEDKQRERPAGETWYDRKRASVNRLAGAADEIMLIEIGDKLSNIRSTYEDYLVNGDKIWSKFNQKNKDMHGWYYRELLAKLHIFDQTAEYLEMEEKVDYIFGTEL